MEFLRKFIFIWIIWMFGHQCLAQIATLQSDHPRGIYAIKGDYCFDLRNYEKALENYVKALEQKPSDTRSMLKMAHTYQKMGNTASAKSWFEKALELTAPEAAAYVFPYIDVLQEVGMKSEAQTWSKRYKELNDSELESNSEGEEKPEGALRFSIPIYSSGGDEIELLSDSTESYRFSIKSASNYTLTISKINCSGTNADSVAQDGNEIKYEEMLTIIDVAQAGKYNFSIQKLIEVDGGTDSDILNPSAHGILGNPGELITFEFIPKDPSTTPQNGNRNTTNIIYKEAEAGINPADTIVFGYVIEGIPPMPAEEELMDEEPADSTALDEEALASNMEVDSLAKDSTEQENMAALAAAAAAADVSLGDSSELKITEVDPDNEDDLEYRVLIAASETKLTPQQIREIYSGDKEVKFFEEFGYYIYYISEEPTYHDADKILEEIGVEDAVVAAYKGNERQEITLPEMLYGRKSFVYSMTEEDMQKRQELLDDTMFRVMIAAADSKLSTKQLKDIYDGDREVEVVEEDGTYKYYIAEEEDFSEAEKILGESNVDEGWIATYKDGKEQDVDLAEFREAGTSNEDEYGFKETSGSMNDMTYRVLITASETKLTEAQLREIYDGDKEVKYFKEFGYYVYYIEEAPTFEDAERVKEELGVKNAFVASYLGNGRQIPNIPKILYRDESFVYNESEEDLQRKKEMEDMQFRVMVAASENELSQEQLKELYPDGDLQVVEEDGMYKYYIEDVSDFSDAEKLLAESGVEDGYIAAYKNGEEQQVDFAEFREAGTSNEDEYGIEETTGSMEDMDTQYRVLITASDTKLTEKQLREIYSGDKDVKYFEEFGYYVYYIEEAPTFEDAERLKEELGLENALIAAYKGNNRQEVRSTALSEKINTIQKTPSADPVEEAPAEDLEYRVLIAASETKLTPEQIREIYDGDKEVKMYEEFGYYIYYITEEPTYDYNNAEQILDEIGVENAVIASYKGNDRQEVIVPDRLFKKKAFVYSVSDQDIQKRNEQLDGMMFRVMIATSKNKLSAKQLREIYPSGDPEPQVVKEDGMYKYYIAEEADLSSAEQLLANSGVQDGYIAAYKNGEEQQVDLAEFREAGTSNEDEYGIEETSGSMEDMDTQYRVLLTASETKLTEAQLREIYDGDKEVKYFQEFGYYVYYIEEAPTFEDAERLKEELGIENAYVAAYKGNTRQQTESNQLAEVLEKIDEAAAADDRLQYRVQIAASKTRLSDEQLKEIYSGDKKIEVFKEDGYYKYYIAEVADYFTAKAIMDGSGVKNAFIAAYEGDEKRKLHIPKIEQENIWQNSSGADNQFVPIPAEIEGLEYRVQILAMKNKLKKSKLKSIYKGDRDIMYFKEDGLHKYFIAREPNYFVAKQILNACGISNAFIVAYSGKDKYVLMDAMASQYGDHMGNNGIDTDDSTLKLITVNFKYDAFTLPSDQQVFLREFITNNLLGKDNNYVIVNGHTDIQGSDTYNWGLSEERALSVKKMIVNEGIDPERVKTFYFGETKVARSCVEHENCDESIHKENRRVEILLLSENNHEPQVRASE